MENKNWITIVAILGGLSVALGAFGSHVVQSMITEKDFDIYRTATRYQMWHTLAMLGVIALGEILKFEINRIQWSFLLGILLFSGSLYLLVFTQLRWFGAVTPLGGVAFLLGWFFLAKESL